tara:strand:- start:479 stop:1279 length:801 start_codon:yes stop_codon:yes gene_type:complete
MKRSLSSLITDTNVREFRAIEIDILSIKKSDTQARTNFDKEKISELSQSIKKNGILQPLIVQQVGPGEYKLIAGERRLRASKEAGLSSVPCLIKDVSSRDAAVIGLVENIQRKQLNTTEESAGYKKLKEEYNLEIKDIATLVGKSRSYVSNLLRLSKLSSKVYKALQDELVTMGQVKPIINLEEEQQDMLLAEILNLKLSSREVEDKVRNISDQGKERSEELLHYKNFLEDKTGSKVDIRKKTDRLKVTLNFFTEDDLKSFIKKIK